VPVRPIEDHRALMRVAKLVDASRKNEFVTMLIDAGISRYA
jgi:hypothetical protein